MIMSTDNTMKLRYSAYYDYGTGPILLGTARDLDAAVLMAKHACAPEFHRLSWVVDHGTEHAPAAGVVARFASYADAPGYDLLAPEF
jgi:hypothetical protein